MNQRTRLKLNLGNLLEVAGAALGVWSAYRYFGLTGALLVAAVLCVVAAEFLYDDVVLRIPLPRVGYGLRRAGRGFASAARAFTRSVGSAGRSTWRVVVEHSQP